MPEIKGKCLPRSSMWIVLVALFTLSRALGADQASPLEGSQASHEHEMHQHAANHPAAASASFFDDLFKVYVPRRVCMFYEQPVIWLHLVSDLLIAVAYYSIPFTLVYFIRRRKDLAFGWMFAMFAAFILACGTTHLVGVADLWYPLYKIDGLVKLFTAGLSIATAVALWPLIPKALALPSPAQLETMVRERTAELATANAALAVEIQARAAGEEAQRRLVAIVESSDDAIVGKTPEGIITSWNAAAEQLFGSSAQEAIGSSILKIVPRDREQEERQILERLQRGERIRHFETVKVRKDGSPIDVSVAISPITNATGTIIGASSIVRDISAQKRIQKEREQLLDSERSARAQAERTVRTKDEFLAVISHELRTPINAILGWAQLLGHGPQDADSVKQGLEVIERNSRVQAKLIEELLDLSRIEAGKIRLDVQKVNPASFIQAAIDAVAPAAEAKGIKIRSVLDPLAGPMTGDPSRLQQVVWNLLNNAIKFTPKGGRVEVLLERVNSHLELTVSDTGEGIKPEFLPHVFDRFRQSDTSLARHHAGLGIGLSIVKSLVEMHGGTVRAKSAGEGQGATFIVVLPLRVTEVEEAGREHPSTGWEVANLANRRSDLQGTRILVVDDEPDARDLVKRLLEECGAVVEASASGDEAMKILEQTTVDVIVSDIGMPGQDGYQLLKAIREQGWNTPALALTAFARAGDRLRALHAGYQMHLAKPVEAAELIASVGSLAGRIGRG